MADPRGITRFVRLVLDRRSARKVEDDVKDSGERQTRALSSQFRRLGGIIAGVFSVAIITRFARAMFDLGASVVETGSKFRTTFGEASAQLDAFLERFAHGAGLTKRQGRDMAATIGAISQGMGAARIQSAGFSERVLELAGDLQSFHNVPIEETFQAIRSFLTGETEPMKRFGVVVGAVEVELRALRDTGKSSKDELTQFELAQARLNLMFERSGVAIGDLNRTMDSQANTARSIGARYEEWKESIAFGLLPVFSILLTDLGRGTQALEDHKSATERAVGGFRDFVGGMRSFTSFVIALFQSIPIRFERFLGRTILSLAQYTIMVERIINRIRIAAGEETIDISSGLIATGTRMIQEASANMRALATRYEESVARIVAAATVLEDTTVTPPVLPGMTPPAAGGAGGAAADPLAVTPQVETRPLIAGAEALRPMVDELESTQRVIATTQDAFQSTFELIHNGSESASKSLGQLGLAMAQSGTEGVARLAEAKVGENVARAIEEVALGIGRSALGDAAGASAHFTSAAQHGLAASAWGALGGIAGGSASSSAGGGGGFVPQGPADVGGQFTEQMDVGGGTHIYIDPIDPNNPVHQREIGRLVRNAGDRGLVTVHMGPR